MTFAEELRNAVTYGRETPTRVLEVEEGLPELVRMAQAKDLFGRFPWTLMGLSGPAEDQLRALFRRRDPSAAFAQTAIWLTPTCARTFVRLDARTAFASLVVGSDVTPDHVLEFFRAMYDVGIERLTGAIRKDHPYYEKAVRIIPGMTSEPHPVDPESVTVVYPVDAKGPRP